MKLSEPDRYVVLAFATVTIVVVALDLWNVLIQHDEGGMVSALALLVLAGVYITARAREKKATQNGDE